MVAPGVLGCGSGVAEPPGVGVLGAGVPVAGAGGSVDGLAGAIRTGPTFTSGTFHSPPASSAESSGSGRTAPRIGIAPTCEIFTTSPVRGACTTRPPPMYIPMWVAPP